MSDFKSGDVVQLRSGGPLMTVRHAYNINQSPAVDCDWFVDDDRKMEVFYERQLTKVTRKSLRNWVAGFIYNHRSDDQQ